jgi:SAM-dependent methyltransferase
MRATVNHPAIHLDAASLVVGVECCPICRSQTPRRIVAVIQEAPRVYLLSCPNCLGCSASHMPKPEVLDAYYGADYFHGDGPRTTLDQVNRFVNNLLRTVSFERKNSTIRLLDFGGGDGTLGLAVARKLLDQSPERDVHFTLVDYQTPRAFEPHERLTVSHERHLARVNGPFDIVLASAVLEHIPDLHGVLEQLFSLLAPRGWFYARTPYVAPLKRLFKQFDISYPGHVHDLGAPFWNRVPATFEQGLRLIASRPSLVETHLLRQPARTVSAWLMKLPARLELAALPTPRTPCWRLVGGWEVILQRRSISDALRNHRAHLA